MDYNYGNGDYNNSPNKIPQNTDKNTNGLSIAALALSILAFISCWCVFTPFVFGGLAIILALLSRGTEKHLNKKSIVSIVTSSAAIVFAIAFMVFYIVIYAQSSGSGEVQSILDQYEQDFEQPYLNDDYQNNTTTPDTI